jgi:pimeloyl-ACP methyl ester carboxylesterase
MPEFDSDGVRLHYVLAGPDDGQPIVLVHGFASDYELNWVGTRWQETLTRSGRLVIGLDCRGHGHSEKPHAPEAYAPRVMAADVVRLLDELGVAEAEYLGYSMGSRIGLEVVARHEARCSKAVLGGLGRWGGRERGAQGEARPGPTRAELIARRMRGDSSVQDPQAEMFYRFAAARPINDLEALACCILGQQSPIDDRLLAATTVPVAIMTGDRDEVAPHADEVARLIPGARHVPIEGRDHMNAVPARQFKEAALAFLGPV